MPFCNQRTPQNVSILLVVELAFEGLVQDRTPFLFQVSILLVVELAFEVPNGCNAEKQTYVSILLVVELAFEEQQNYKSSVFYSCFNPSCSGIGF